MGKEILSIVDHRQVNRVEERNYWNGVCLRSQYSEKQIFWPAGGNGCLILDFRNGAGHSGIL